MGSVHSKLLHVEEYVYDFAVDGGSVGAINLSAKDNMHVLPLGAVVKSVVMKVVTAFTSGGAATVAWGPTSDADGYSGTPVAVASLTANAVFRGYEGAAALLWQDTNDHPLFYPVLVANDSDMKLTIAAAALTAGKSVLWVEYYKPTLS